MGGEGDTKMTSAVMKKGLNSNALKLIAMTNSICGVSEPPRGLVDFGNIGVMIGG